MTQLLPFVSFDIVTLGDGWFTFQPKADRDDRGKGGGVEVEAERGGEKEGQVG